MGAGCQGLRVRRSGWSTAPYFHHHPLLSQLSPRQDSPPLRGLQPCPPGCAKPRPEKSQAPCGTHLAVGPLPQRRSHCQGPQEEHDQGGGGGGTPREQEPRAEVRQEQLSLLVGPTLPHQTPHKYPVKHTLASPLRVMKRFSDSPKTQQAQGQG